MTMTEFNKANPFRNPWSRSPRDHYWGEMPIKQMELEKIIDENTPTPWFVDDLPHELSPHMMQLLKNHAIRIGFTQGELDELIAWRPRTLHCAGNAGADSADRTGGKLWR